MTGKLGFVFAGATHALLWWALAREGPGMLAFGAFAALAAAVVGRWLASPRAARLRWSRLPRFLAFFIANSLRGGLDVARRAIARDMRLRPSFLVVELHLPSEPARVLATVVVSLLPGTLAARLDGRRLRLHALDARGPIEAEVRRLEREIALLFGETAC